MPEVSSPSAPRHTVLVLFLAISQAAALTTALTDVKAQLTKSLKYNKAFTETSEGLVQTLVDSAAAAPGVTGDYWAGKFMLRSSNAVEKLLRSVGAPMLDGAPVTVTVGEGGSLELETDILVLQCATGLRVFGSVAPEDDGSAAALSVVLSNCEFFEPSEEFGITQALEKCEAELRPKLPSDEQRVGTTLTPLFGDDDTLIFRADDVGLLVLSRSEQEYEVAKRRRG